MNKNVFGEKQTKVTLRDFSGRVWEVPDVQVFSGFYDRDGKPIFIGDIVVGTVRHSTRAYSKGRDLDVPHYFQLRRMKTGPSTEFFDMGPVIFMDVPASMKYTTYPSFECKPKSLFWYDEKGKMANQWHYDEVAHLPEEVRYLSIPDIRLSKSNG